MKFKNKKSEGIFSIIMQIRPLISGIINLTKYSSDIIAEMKDLKAEEYMKLIDYCLDKSKGLITEDMLVNTLEGFSLIGKSK